MGASTVLQQRIVAIDLTHEEIGVTRKSDSQRTWEQEKAFLNKLLEDQQRIIDEQRRTCSPLHEQNQILWETVRRQDDELKIRDRVLQRSETAEAEGMRQAHEIGNTHSYTCFPTSLSFSSVISYLVRLLPPGGQDYLSGDNSEPSDCDDERTCLFAPK